jgi:hypothetical protein
VSSESPIAPEAPLSVGRPFRAQRASFVFLAYFGVQFVAGFVAGAGMAIWYAASGRGSALMTAEVMRNATMLGAVSGMIVGGIVAYSMTRQLVGRVAEGHPLAAFGWSSSTSRSMLVAILAGVVLGILYMLASLVFAVHALRMGVSCSRHRAAGGGGSAHWPSRRW